MNLLPSHPHTTPLASSIDAAAIHELDAHSHARFAAWRHALALSGFRRRDRQDEWMDEPDLDPRLHHAALKGLARLNRLSGAARILATPLWQLARQQGLQSPKILDLASGAGDLAVRLWRSGRRLGFEPHIVGWDKSPLAVEHARLQAVRCGADIEFAVRDLFDLPPAGPAEEGGAEPFDIVLCSLFLHHLDEPQAIQLLRRMAQLSRHLVLVNDLQRGRLNYLLVIAASRLVTRSPVVHADAAGSMRAAFTRQEIAQLAKCAGMDGARVETRWPCRLLLSWRKPQ